MRPTGDDVRRVSAVIGVSPGVHEGQTKTKLATARLKGRERRVNESSGALEEHPKEAKMSVEKGMPRPRAREARRAGARADAPQEQPGRGRLPGKLADCRSKSNEDTELSSSKAIPPVAQPSKARFQHSGDSSPRVRSQLEKANLVKDVGRGNRTIISALGCGIRDDSMKRSAVRQDHHHDRRHVGRIAHPHAALTFFFRTCRS